MGDLINLYFENGSLYTPVQVEEIHYNQAEVKVAKCRLRVSEPDLPQYVYCRVDAEEK